MNLDHSEWTDKLSEYLDGELPDDERYAVESHLAGCAACSAVLADLKRVVARARNLDARPPQADLWADIAARIDRGNVVTFDSDRVERRASSAGRRVSFTLPQLAAAAALLIAISGGLAWYTAERMAADRPAEATTAASTSPEPDASANAPQPEREALAERSGDPRLATVSASDPHYDAAVADLEKALHQGRGRLDKATIAIVEHNLQIIDQAIAQAQLALSSDPANSYLSSHLFEARRRKLDLLRRAAALAEAN